AWIYQRMESVALQAFVDMADETPLLAAHDCLFFKRKLLQPLETDIRYKLNQKFSLLNFEHEEIRPIGLLNADIDSEVALHKQFIAEQERDAMHYTSPAIESSMN